MSQYRQLWINEQKARLDRDKKLNVMEAEYNAAVDLLQQVHTITNMVDLERFQADVNEYQLVSAENLGWKRETEDAA